MTKTQRKAPQHPRCSKCGRGKLDDGRVLCGRCRSIPRQMAEAKRPKPVGDRADRRRRRCLKCGKMFESWGPGNRRCDSCTTRLSGVEEIPAYAIVGMLGH